VAAAAVATLVVIRSDSGNQVPLGKLHAINVLDVRTGKYAGSAAVGINASSTRSIAGSIWAEGEGVLYKIDPAKRRVQRTIAVGNSNGLAGGAGAIWLVLADRPTLVRVDARYAVVRRFRLPRAGLDPAQDDLTPVSVAFGAGSVWVGQQGRLLRIDPDSGKLQGAPIETPFTPSLLTFGDGSVYLGEHQSGQVAKIDSSSNQVIWKTRLHPWLPSMLAAAGYLWVTVDSDAGVHKFDERTGRELGLVHTGAGPDTLTYDGDHIWVNNWRADTVTSIDPVSGTTHSHRLPGTPTGPMAISNGQVWVPTQGAAKNLSTIKGDVLRVVQREDWIGGFDPARSWDAKRWQLAYAVEAKLFNYLDPDSTHAGNELAPELAADWPKITDGGRTYTFKIRDGFRFSPPSNAPVTAATLKYSFERALSGDWAPASDFLPEIVGEQPFRDGAAKHVSGLVADGDTFTIRLTRPEPALPTILTLPFFSPVPIGTPADGLNVENTPIPSAGPYYIAASNEGWWQILKRNPNYGGDRPQHLDAIVYETGIDTGPAAKRIEAGTLDYASESYPDSGVFVSGGQISKTYGGERRDGRPWWAPMPDPGLRFLGFNVRGVFRDPDLRKAVAWAIDRPSLAAVDGGIAWDRMLPPTLPEVGTRHVYPVQHPDASSLARARSLMHGRQPTVVLATCPQSNCAERARILRDDLAAIGIRVKVRTSDDVYSDHARTDIFDSGWFMDTLDAANILRYGMFDEGAFQGITGFDDPVWRRKVLRASRLAGAARDRAFAHIDLAMTRQASPWAVFEQPADPAMFSDRVGCLEFSPVYSGPDLAAACIK
jgi:ABC-type transport system substrate-binding protein/sugar lactone lactonase YvrE